MKKLILPALLGAIMMLSTGCATQVTMQPIHQPLSFNQEGVTIEVVGVGHTKEWTEVEVAVANATDQQVQIKDREIYVRNEKGYYIVPYQDYEINQKIYSRTGKYMNPLTLGALGAVITAIVLPQSHDRETAARIAGALLLGAIGKEVGERQAAESEQVKKGDTIFRNYTIPPNLKLGGKVYFPPMDKATGLKMLLYVSGRPTMFELEIKDEVPPAIQKTGTTEQ
ncbi:MAG: hypothetical protein OEV28_10355 [Nitrospirota bacterium]|nr:hypothetical protein [Nitrospirota bacterium]